MLRISKLTDYAIVLLSVLGTQDKPYSRGEGFTKYSVEYLVTQTQLPITTIRKVMKYLVDAKFVLAHRGIKGGYQLALSLTKISLLDVVQTIEGKIKLTECATEDSECEISNKCLLSGSWHGMNDLLVNFFKNINLHQLNSPNNQEIFENILPKNMMSDHAHERISITVLDD
jgi:Rrf2 family iron-sulfur cluster assembly transcriptional regulator